MSFHSLNRNPVLQASGLQITNGFGHAGLLSGRKTENQTYVYSASSSLLKIDAHEINLPARSVSLVRPGVMCKLETKNPEFGYVFETLAEPILKINGKEEKVRISRDEANSHILDYFGGQVTVYTDESRILPNNGPKKSGWFTHNFKNSALAIAEAVWTALRDNEVPHRHALSTEITIVLAGSATLLVNNERVKLGENELFIFSPEERQYHMIERIGIGQKHGNHRHISLQYPALFDDARDRLVFPA